MQCITGSEIDHWLQARGIPQGPCSRHTSPAFYLQFRPPSKHRQLDAFIRHYYERIIPDADSLVHITDWGLYQPSEMIAITGIRSAHEEKRPLIEASGHVLTSHEKEAGIALFSLSASFAWKAYLYAPLHHSTLYNWEGELFDFWTGSEQAESEMKRILKQFDLRETE